jgi:uncharacterized protein with GYD domain
MPHYLLRASYTPEAWAKLVKEPQNRREAVRSAVETVGGKLEALYYAFGEDDAVVLIEAPDNVSAAALSIAVAAAGALKSATTTVLMTVEEAVEAMRKAGASSYRPPS